MFASNWIIPAHTSHDTFSEPTATDQFFIPKLDAALLHLMVGGIGIVQLAKAAAHARMQREQSTL
jgi:hypothetical protein